MRAFAEAWSDEPFVQQAAAQISYGTCSLIAGDRIARKLGSGEVKKSRLEDDEKGADGRWAPEPATDLPTH